MKIDRQAPIGVFDSGVGGLTVAREIMRNLPNEKIVYFGIRHGCLTVPNPRRPYCAIPVRSSAFCRRRR